MEQELPTTDLDQFEKLAMAVNTAASAGDEMLRRDQSLRHDSNFRTLDHALDTIQGLTIQLSRIRNDWDLLCMLDRVLTRLEEIAPDDPMIGEASAMVHAKRRCITPPSATIDIKNGIATVTERNGCVIEVIDHDCPEGDGHVVYGDHNFEERELAERKAG